MATSNTAKKVNYSEQDVARLHDMYASLGNDGMEQIAAALNKSVRSVRAKLVRDGIYVAPEKGATTSKKKEGPSKKEMIAELETVSPFPVDGFLGATKEAIGHLISFLRKPEAN
jgi:hypothetical protein